MSEEYDDGYRAGYDDGVESKAAQIAALKTVMVAAAEEIAAHWNAHCDAEGYGPQNLLRRLEEGIPSEYGYTAGAFAALTAERDAARELADSEGSRAVDYLRRARRAEASLREVLELCAAGDVDESTEALGWGDAIRRANQALAARTQAHKPAIKGQTP